MKVVRLRQAHELLNREWPGQDAPGPAWVAYHKRAVRLYDQVAESDPDHHHEALYWAGQAREALHALTQDAVVGRAVARGGAHGQS